TVDTEAEPGVTWEGEGANELPTDGTDMVSRAIARTVERQRGHHPGAEIGSFSLHGVNRIPLERGLGSSSAAAVAGVALARVLLGPTGFDDTYTTFTYAAEFEGHPDNAAPATYGGAPGFGGSGPPCDRDPARGSAPPPPGPQRSPSDRSPGRRGLQHRPRRARRDRPDAG